MINKLMYIFILAIMFGGCVHSPQPKQENRLPAADADLLISLRQAFGGKLEYQSLFKGKTKVAIKGREVETTCFVEIFDWSTSKSPYDYVSIAGIFPRLQDVESNAPSPERFRLLGMVGGSTKTAASEVRDQYVDFESIRTSGWGNEVKERVIVEGNLAANNLKLRFITRPLTLGFALPIDRTDATCYELKAEKY